LECQVVFPSSFKFAGQVNRVTGVDST